MISCSKPSPRVRPRDAFKLVVLAGGSFEPFVKDVQRLGLNDRVIVRENVNEIEDYLQAADLGLFTSETESFCLSILEAMYFGCPSVARRAGGIPEVVEDNVSGLLVPSDNPDDLARAIESLIQDPKRRTDDGSGRAAPGARTVFRRGHCAALRGALSPGVRLNRMNEFQEKPLTRGAATRTLPPSSNHLEKVESNCKRPCLHNPF